jgi:hypothetical protein
MRETLTSLSVFFLFHSSNRVVEDHFLSRITHLHLFRFSLDLNKWFSHISSVFFCVFFRDFVVWVRCCVVHRLVRCCMITRLVVVFVWFILKDQLYIIDSINDLDVNVADPEPWVFKRFRFYHIIYGICSLYIINLGVLSWFTDSSFTFLAMLILMYSLNLNEWISFCFCQKNK